MKFKIFRLILLCLTAIFIVYLYTENTGDNACFNKSLETFGKNRSQIDDAYYDCFVTRHRKIY